MEEASTLGTGYSRQQVLAVMEDTGCWPGCLGHDLGWLCTMCPFGGPGKEMKICRRRCSKSHGKALPLKAFISSVFESPSLRSTKLWQVETLTDLGLSTSVFCPGPGAVSHETKQRSGSQGKKQRSAATALHTRVSALCLLGHFLQTHSCCPVFPCVCVTETCWLRGRLQTAAWQAHSARSS